MGKESILIQFSSEMFISAKGKLCLKAGNGAGQGLLSAQFSSTTNGMQTLPTADHHPLKAHPARRTT